MSDTASQTHIHDMVVIGAGIAGIGFAAHYKRKFKDADFVILEAREDIGGTWSMFRYPGIRSDIDMFVYGYKFKPWTGPAGMASAEQIMTYLREVVDEEKLFSHLKFDAKVVSTEWSSANKTWKVIIKSQSTRKTIYTRWLQYSAGYFSHEQAHTPKFENSELFEGDIIEPQFWPENISVKGKKIAVVGSGATAITLVPALVNKGATVSMIQRTPTYIFAGDEKDYFVDTVKKWLPARLAYWLIRWRNLALAAYVQSMAKRKPDKLQRLIERQAKKYLPNDFDYQRYFSPPYKPYEQRLCFAPKGDFFKAISSSHAKIINGGVQCFSKNGLTLQSGQKVDADIVVLATGLKMTMFANIPIKVDGKLVKANEHLIYRGIMLSDIPNLALTVGSLIAPYTSRVEMIAQWVCRLHTHMQKVGANEVRPQPKEDITDHDILPFTTQFNSSYVLRAQPNFPKQLQTSPWVNPQTFAANRKIFAETPVDSFLQFS